MKEDGLLGFFQPLNNSAAGDGHDIYQALPWAQARGSAFSTAGVLSSLGSRVALLFYRGRHDKMRVFLKQNKILPANVPGDRRPLATIGKLRL